MWQEKLGQLDLALAQLAEAEENKRELEKKTDSSARSISFCGSSALRKDGYAQTHERIWTGSHRLSEIIWRI